MFIATFTSRLAASLLCALVLGIERKTRQHTVGMRTLILIGLSSTLLCLLSTHLVGEGNAGDPTRVAAGVVTGIGFLGGGAIMRQGLNIRGLTSAAVIWTVAALGLVCGAGLFVPAIMVLAISLVSLVALEHTEGHYSTEMTKTLTITYSSPPCSDGVPTPCRAKEPPTASAACQPCFTPPFRQAHSPAFRRGLSPASAAGQPCDVDDAARKVLFDMGYIVRDVNAEADKESGTLTVEYSVKAPPKGDAIALINAISKNSAVEHVSLSDG